MLAKPQSRCFSDTFEIFIKIKAVKRFILFSCSKLWNSYSWAGHWLLITVSILWNNNNKKPPAKRAARLGRHQSNHVSNSLCRWSCHRKETHSGRNEFVVWESDSLCFLLALCAFPWFVCHTLLHHASISQGHNDKKAREKRDCFAVYHLFEY